MPPSSQPPSASGSSQQRLARRAGIVALGTLASRLLGLVREQVLAACFSRAATDIFFVAFLIPNVLRQLLAEGATQNGVLPVLAQVQQQHGEAHARAFFRALRGLSLLLLGATSALGIWLAPHLVELFAGGFHDSPGKFERTVWVTRWVFPYIFFMGTAALGVAALNTHRRFVVTSFAPALLNVAFVAAALLLPTHMAQAGWDPLAALAVGVLVGGGLQVVAQWPSLRTIGYLQTPTLKFNDPHVREVLQRMAPVLFGFGVYYVDVFVARHLLSDMGEGAPSYFTFAQRLCDFPQGIFVMAIQSASLPSLARLAAKKDRAGLRNTLGGALSLALFVAIPASALLSVLAGPLVQLVFERGHFDAEATRQTAAALTAQACGIWMVAGVRQLVVVFYALGDTKTPVWISAADFVVFLGCALALMGPLGHVGISWAVTASSAVQFALLLMALRKRVGGLRGLGVATELRKTLLASALAAAAGWALLQAAPQLTGDAWWTSLLPGLIGSATFVVVFLGAAFLFGSQQLQMLLGPGPAAPWAPLAFRFCCPLWGHPGADQWRLARPARCGYWGR